MSCCDDKPRAGAKGSVAHLSGSRRWMILAAMAVAAGLALGWEQLVVLGVAPLLMSVLPCLVMCGLGLCMMKCKDKGASSVEQPEAVPLEQPPATPARD